MSLASLQVCMDSSDWLQGSSIHEEAAAMDSSSSPSGDMLACPRPLMERRLRPPHDQALKCPRCDSTNTKFCYYNNYSLSQPRYFCKTCRRYWTKGGTLRNIPVGGGCRKNKKVSAKKSNDNNNNNHNGFLGNSSSPSSNKPTDLHLSFPEVQLSHLPLNMLGSVHHGTNLGISHHFMETKYENAMLQNPRPIDFMDSKLEALVGIPRNYDFMGNNGEMGMINGGLGADISSHNGLGANIHSLSSPFGVSLDGNNSNNNGVLMDNFQRLMLPYEANEDNQNGFDVKPNAKLLSLEWQDQGCLGAGKDSFGYLSNNLGSWSTAMNGYGSSTTNPLV